MGMMTTRRKAGPLGVALRKARGERGLSQYALADASGVSRATIANLESGYSQVATTETVEMLAAALGIGPDDLMRAEPAPPSGVADIEPLLQRFLSGAAAASAQPTSEEIDWLRSLPGIYWAGGTAPNEMTIYHLIMAYRATRR